RLHPDEHMPGPGFRVRQLHHLDGVQAPRGGDVQCAHGCPPARINGAGFTSPASVSPRQARAEGSTGSAPHWSGSWPNTMTVSGARIARRASSDLFIAG